MNQEHAESQRNRFARLLEESYDYTRPRRGEIREAVILDIGENDILVDLGGKRDGIIPPKDLGFVNEEYVESLHVGDHIPVSIMKTWGNEDGILVSLNKGLAHKDWLRAQDLLESGKIFEGDVTGHNRGGVLVSFGRLRGFVPNSHLTSIPRGLRGNRLKEAKEDLVGETIPLVVIEVNQRRRRLVLSERLADRRRSQRLLDELTEGEVRKGTVCNIVDFGAFVDLGGIDGLIHISELDWKHVDHPREILQVGEEVETYVLDVDRERKRIALSRKRLLPDPWDSVVENLNAGEEVRGTITSIVPFGIFVEVGEGVDGLVHTSEMPNNGQLMEELETGTPVTVEVLDIDNWQHQIALRLIEVHEETPEEESVEESTPAEEAHTEEETTAAEEITEQQQEVA
jgi:small subunit ribosomal protein S1